MTESIKTASAGSVGIAYRTLTDGTRIAIATIDFPPINAGSLPQRRAVLDCFRRLAGEPDLAGAVLTGAGGNFVGGADIREFDFPPEAPHLPELIEAIENCPFPVVAAIDGAALGGGFELALGCDARVVTPRAVVGLPEVTLGLIPGAGGTLRLSRLVDTARTVEIVTSGRRVKSVEALELCLVDAIAEGGDLIETAIAHLEVLNGGKRKLRDLPAILATEEAFAKAAASALTSSRGSNAVREAIDAIRESMSLPVDEALERERSRSLRLRREPQSRALRHLFFAEKAAMKLLPGVPPGVIHKVGVVGTGRMGQGIALAFAQRGIDVRLAEKETAALAIGLKAVAQSVDALVARGRVASAEDVMSRLTAGPLTDMADCQLVIEAVFEDMSIKKTLLSELDAILPTDAIVATNTSYLDIDEMASDTVNPSRVAGLHFFNPANVMRLVEIVRGKRTDDRTIATLFDLARKIGKLPVLANVCDGFIGNRIFAAYRQQCEYLLEEGLLPQDVDQAMREFGFAMGPFEVFDLAGLDIAWARRKRLTPYRDSRCRYVEVADRLCETGRLGKKSGKGWYRYDAGKPVPDPIVEDLILEASRSKGIHRQTFTPTDIQHRLVAAMVNEAAALLGEGIAQRPSDIDVVLVHGYGFPRLKGGPLHWASAQPRPDVLAVVSALAKASGHGFEIAPNLEQVLDQADML